MKHTTSTNKLQKKNIPKIPKSLVLTGKTLQYASLNLATLFAVKLFKTPPRFKIPKHEKKMALACVKELVYIPEINKKIMVYTYGNSHKKALLIHGWAGRGTQLFSIADKLLENGFMTISFDAPAHGMSASKTTMMTEFIACTKFLEKKTGDFEIGIGHSLGGMVILNSVNQGLKLNKCVVIGSGDIVSDILAVFVNKLELNPKLVSKIRNHFYNKFNVNIDNYSGSVAASEVKVPCLVIHDTEDTEVPVSCAHAIRQNLTQGELLITNGLGHNRILKDSYVINSIVEFINRND